MTPTHDPTDRLIAHVDLRHAVDALLANAEALRAKRATLRRLLSDADRSGPRGQGPRPRGEVRRGGAAVRAGFPIQRRRTWLKSAMARSCSSFATQASPRA